MIVQFCVLFEYIWIGINLKYSKWVNTVLWIILQNPNHAKTNELLASEPASTFLGKINVTREISEKTQISASLRGSGLLLPMCYRIFKYSYIFGQIHEKIMRFLESHWIIIFINFGKILNLGSSAPEASLYLTCRNQKCSKNLHFLIFIQSFFRSLLN